MNPPILSCAYFSVTNLPIVMRPFWSHLPLSPNYSRSREGSTSHFSREKLRIVMGPVWSQFPLPPNYSKSREGSTSHLISISPAAVLLSSHIRLDQIESQSLIKLGARSKPSTYGLPRGMTRRTCPLRRPRFSARDICNAKRLNRIRDKDRLHKRLRKPRHFSEAQNSWKFKLFYDILIFSTNFSTT